METGPAVSTEVGARAGSHTDSDPRKGGWLGPGGRGPGNLAPAPRSPPGLLCTHHRPPAPRRLLLLPHQGCSRGKVPVALWGPDGEGCPHLPPPVCILSSVPGPAAVFTLSPVYFASSAHTAFADTRRAVGWENFFLLCFCRKRSWLRAGHGVSWVSRPRSEDVGGKGPPPDPILEPRPGIPFCSTGMPPAQAPAISPPQALPWTRQAQSPRTGTCPGPFSACPVLLLLLLPDKGQDPEAFQPSSSPAHSPRAPAKPLTLTRQLHTLPAAFRPLSLWVRLFFQTSMWSPASPPHIPGLHMVHSFVNAAQALLRMCSLEFLCPCVNACGIHMCPLLACVGLGVRHV